MAKANFCTNCGSLVKEDGQFCSQCGAPVRQVSAEPQPTGSVSKRTRHPMSKKVKAIYTIVALGAAGLYLSNFINHLPGKAHPVISQQPEVAMESMSADQHLAPQPIEIIVENGSISFPLAVLQNKKMVEFEYASVSGAVPLLAYISPQGKLVTAIRMCEPCNSKTFRTEGDELICGNCETRWKLNTLEGVQGSCQKYPPDPIASEIIGDRVVIKEEIVKNWKMRI